MKTAGKIVLALVAVGVFLYFFDIRVADGRVEISRRDGASRSRIDRAVGGLADRQAPGRTPPAQVEDPPVVEPHRDLPKSDRRALEAILEEEP